MNYTQLVTPNLDPVVHQGGAALNDWLGWCLAVAWTAFGGKTTDPTAWSAWTNSVKYKHTDALPSGVYVPVWFSGYGGSGHVAIYKDGTVWSSPYTHKTSMDVLNSIAQVEKYYRVTYAGWSEDIGSVRVVEPVTEGDSMTKDQAVELARRIGLLAGMSEAAITADWVDYQANHIVADANYAAGLAKQLYDSHDWQVFAYKAGHYDADVKAAGGTGTVLAPGTYTVK